MPYAEYLTIADLKFLDLLDDVEYKFIKVYDDDDDIEVDIESVNSYTDGKYPNGCCHTKFVFTLEEKRFKIKIDKTLHYTPNSAFALFIGNLYQEDYNEDEEDDE
jgi:hypothetical protein